MSPSSSHHRLIGENIDKAVSYLQRGEIIAFPTETFYGLGVDPYCSKGVKRLFEIKNRPIQKAILLLVAEKEAVNDLVTHIPDIYYPLIDEFWPGPLTLVFPARPSVDHLLTGGTGNIGVRISSHPLARELCRSWGRPVTATSANTSGQLPSKTPAEVEASFSTSVKFVLDGGTAEAERGSTIVGYSGKTLQLIREGTISFDTVCKVVG